METYKKLSHCRVCESIQLHEVLNLGMQELTGVFPKDKNAKITCGPLDLVWCEECALLQLGHTYNADEMYGDNYGYRSGLNASMVAHLTNKINYLENAYALQPGDIVVDIGSNDATSLKAYKTPDVQLVGIDPTGNKFKEFYPAHITLIPDFFSPDLYTRTFTKKAKIVTSIAMFYDLDAPVDFVRGIESILHDEGIWHFEQSYMPAMLRLCSYDTVCHEHLEYYSLNTVNYILKQANMRIVDVTMNNANGGSFAITVCKQSSPLQSNTSVIEWLLDDEIRKGFNTIEPYKVFAQNVKNHKENLCRLLDKLNKAGKKVFGYGASTKGNAVLQYCNITHQDLIAIAEVNEEKFGAFTPGTHIPIVSEKDVKAQNPDFLLVLPWHFKEGILARETAYLTNGGKFIFPFPEIEII